MEARTRSRNKLVSGGQYYTNGVLTGQESYFETEEGIEDYYKKHKRPKLRLLPVSNGDIYRTVRVPPIYSSDPASYFRLVQVRPMKDAYPDLSGYPWRGSGQRDTENQYFVNRLLAETHPFRSEYSIPVSLVEMLDISSLFKITARSLSDLVGSSYLSYKFGILQFVQDLRTLSGITKAIESRVKEFNSLNLHGGLRRSIRFGDIPLATTSGSQTIWSTYGHFVTADWTNRRRYEIYGSVRWQWKDGVTISLTKLEAFNEAVKAVFDLGQLDASTIWNAIPWTWLVDYFVDVNSWLSANENTSWVTPYDICITRVYQSRTDWKNLNCSDGRGYGGYVKWRVKSRDANLSPSQFPAARYSLITKGQYLVLLALLGKFRGSSY